ncbi:MAG TPA: hypothetical protein VK633_05895 [Verrucomicrobiae bacterium]|nr:hypothetical protein [Verrucomicrobiae bacterium]
MYKIMGADQREYGPAASEQVREWIAQGRANGQTLATFEGSPWKPLSTFPEFADALRLIVPPPLGGAAYPSNVSHGRRTNTASVAGLVLCVLGTCCSPLSIVGLILCVVGLIQIQKSPQEYSTGKVIPIIGIIVAILDMVFIAVAISSGAFHELLKNFPR